MCCYNIMKEQFAADHGGHRLDGDRSHYHGGYHSGGSYGRRRFNISSWSPS